LNKFISAGKARRAEEIVRCILFPVAVETRFMTSSSRSANGKARLGQPQKANYTPPRYLFRLAKNEDEAMMLRIIHGKLKPGTWDSYERAYKESMKKAGKIPGLKGRWLAHAVDDPDAGYTMSLWENEAAMRTYESGDILQKTILPQLKPFFSGDYATTRCEVRFAEEFD
jgi:heme-degrading monooxygenase HmoA